MKVLALLSILFFAPQKEEFNEEQLFPTKLRVTVINSLGNIVEGAKVTIYASEKNYRASENPVATLITDDKGRVTFKDDLEPISYFMEVTFEDQDNNGEGVKTETLAKGKMNRVNTVIE